MKQENERSVKDTHRASIKQQHVKKKAKAVKLVD